MKIVVVNKHPKDALGGSEIQSDRIAARLLHRGHEVLYAVAKPGSETRDVPYRTRSLGGVLDLRRMLRTERPDVVYWRYNRSMLLAAALCCRRLGVPLVFAISHVNDVRRWVRVRRNLRPSHPLLFLRHVVYIVKHTLSARINYAAFRYVSGFTSVAAELLERLPAACRSRSRHIRSIAGALEAEAFAWPRPYAVWVANVKRAKNPEAVVRAAGLCRGIGLDFLMVGRIQEASYAYLARGGGLPENLHFLGSRTPGQVEGIIAGARMLIHTCHPEGFPNVFIQAWCLGKPVISLNYDPDGVIERERIGYLSGDLPAMAAQIRRLHDDGKLRMEMGRRAAGVACGLFDPERNIVELEAFLAAVVADHSGGTGDGNG